MKLSEARRDPYRRLAKEEGYRSRAAYKLIQINQRYRLIRRGDYVVDFGAAPGGWLEVASQIVSGRGVIAGIDEKEIDPVGRNVRILISDVNAPGIEDQIVAIMGRRADVVLSDLSPKITGVWEIDHSRQVDLTMRVVDILPAILRKRGSGFFKAFDGPRLESLEKRLRLEFEKVILAKPPASRGASSEIYMIARDFRI